MTVLTMDTTTDAINVLPMFVDSRAATDAVMTEALAITQAIRDLDLRQASVEIAKLVLSHLR